MIIKNRLIRVSPLLESLFSQLGHIECSIEECPPTICTDGQKQVKHPGKCCYDCDGSNSFSPPPTPRCSRFVSVPSSCLAFVFPRSVDGVVPPPGDSVSLQRAVGGGRVHRLHVRVGERPLSQRTLSSSRLRNSEQHTCTPPPNFPVFFHLELM